MKHPLFSNTCGKYNGIKIIPPNFFKKIFLKIKLFFWRLRNKKAFIEYAKCLKIREKSMNLAGKRFEREFEKGMFKFLLK